MRSDQRAEPFDPDWCIAPSETLRDFMGETNLSVSVMAVAWGGRKNEHHEYAIEKLVTIPSLSRSQTPRQSPAAAVRRG